jgi:hypothetical protein
MCGKPLRDHTMTKTGARFDPRVREPLPSGRGAPSSPPTISRTGNKPVYDPRSPDALMNKLAGAEIHAQRARRVLRKSMKEK